jgi:AcrR family transcriptional regulator
MRARLMEAAAHLFAEQGYDATTLKQIVTRADTSIGNCYFYFENKEAILLAIAENLRAEISEIVDAAIAATPPGASQLYAAAYAGTLAVLERAEVARFALSDSAHPALRPLTIQMFTARVEAALLANPNLLAGWPEASPQLAAAAWHGSASHVIEAAIQGKIDAPHTQIAAFVAQWNLRAIGATWDGKTHEDSGAGG